MTRTRTLSIAFLALFAATAAFASWYDDYDEGLKAVRAGRWKDVIPAMTAAIKAHPHEGEKERTYGMSYANYYPFYYRGAAYLNTGNYELAIADLEHTQGIGPENLGSIESLIQRAKSMLAVPKKPEPQPEQPRSVVPAPAPTPAPAPVPLPVQPAAPTIDPALRQQVAGEIANAKARMSAAQQRKAAGAPQYAQATQALTDANTRSATAKSNDDLNAALGAARNAATLFDAAAAPAAVAQQPASRPTAASTLVLGDTSRRVRQALQLYFNGEFEDAARAFSSLSNDMPNNGWIYAFLGASQYSLYAFEIDESYKTKAYDSFRQARRYGKFKNGLPEKYFSKRIRRAFEQTAVQ